MGYQDRDYYQASTRGDRSWGMDSITPVVKYLIIANVAIYLAQIFVTREPSAEHLAEVRRFEREMQKLFKQEAEAIDQPTNQGIHRNQAFGFQLAQGYMNGPLIWGDKSEIIEGQVSALTDAHTSVTD